MCSVFHRQPQLHTCIECFGIDSGCLQLQLVRIVCMFTGHSLVPSPISAHSAILRGSAGTERAEMGLGMRLCWTLTRYCRFSRILVMVILTLLPMWIHLGWVYSVVCIYCTWQTTVWDTQCTLCTYDLCVLLQWLIIFIAHAVCLEFASMLTPPHKPTVVILLFYKKHDYLRTGKEVCSKYYPIQFCIYCMYRYRSMSKICICIKSIPYNIHSHNVDGSCVGTHAI